MAKISVDDLATDRLPQAILDAISKVRVTILEVMLWEQGRPAIRIVFTDGTLVINVRMRIRVKKAVAIFSGVASILWIAIRLGVRYLPSILAIIKQHIGG
jgi:hypothetical protein